MAGRPPTDTPLPARHHTRLCPSPPIETADYQCPTCRWVTTVDAGRVGSVIRCGRCGYAGIVFARPADGDTAVMTALDVYRAPG